MAKQELTVPEQSGFLSVIGDPDIAGIIRENLGADGIDAFALTRVSIPAGGGIAWTVPDPIEGPQVVKSIEGVIVYWATWRAYWQQQFSESGGGTPPDCSSRDGLVGIGVPGGDCYKCPLNEFGTDAKERGKACKEMRALFILREGEVLPILISAPPMSLAPLKSYMLALASRKIPYHGVVTRFDLEQSRSRDSITYSKIAPSVSRQLTAEERDVFAGYRQQLTPAIEGVRVQDVVYNEDE